MSKKVARGQGGGGGGGNKGFGEERVPQLAEGKYESALLLIPCPPALLPWETRCCSRSKLMEVEVSTFLSHWDGVY